MVESPFRKVFNLCRCGVWGHGGLAVLMVALDDLEGLFHPELLL